EGAEAMASARANYNSMIYLSISITGILLLIWKISTSRKANGNGNLFRTLGMAFLLGFVCSFTFFPFSFFRHTILLFYLASFLFLFSFSFSSSSVLSFALLELTLQVFHIRRASTSSSFTVVLFWVLKPPL